MQKSPSKPWKKIHKLFLASATSIPSPERLSLSPSHPVAVEKLTILSFFFRAKIFDDIRRLIQPGDVIGRVVFDLEEPR